MLTELKCIYMQKVHSGLDCILKWGSCKGEEGKQFRFNGECRYLTIREEEDERESSKEN
jgi:hypothetical protein